jgi:hypothetical protein
MAASRMQVIGHHFRTHLLQGNLGNPAQFLFGLGRMRRIQAAFLCAAWERDETNQMQLTIGINPHFLLAKRQDFIRI